MKNRYEIRGDISYFPAKEKRTSNRNNYRYEVP
jgi:hypothetical protein